MIISGVDEKVVVNHDSLYSGLSENEYRYHAIENRSLKFRFEASVMRKISLIARRRIIWISSYINSTTTYES